MWNFSCYFPVILSLRLFSGGKSSSLFWRACFMTLGVLPLPASPYRTPAVTWNHILMDVSTLGAVLDCQIFSWEYILGNFDAGKDWGQEEKRVTEDEMVGWRHRLKGHKFKQTPGDSEGQESLVCCSPWGPKESDMTVTEQPPQTHPIELPWELNETIRTEYLSQYPYRVSFQNTSCF